MINYKELIDWCYERLGEHYLYGYKHQKITESLNKSLKNSYPSVWTTSYYNTAQSWLGSYAVDCSGLISSKTGKERNSAGYKSSATEVISYKSGMDLSNYIGWGIWKDGHIGVIVGSDDVIEARGINYGVVKTKASERSFTHIIKLCDIDYSNEVKEGYTEEAEPEKIWSVLMEEIENPYGTAGLMGNLYAESALIPINLQNSFESKLGYSDKEYTEAVDNGTYNNFTCDSAGYGLAQWTYSTRKQGLKSECDKMNTSVGNLDAQLSYLIEELNNDYSGVMKILKSAESVKEASDYVLTKFEKPADQSDSVKEKRADYGQVYFDTYASGYEVGWYMDMNSGKWWYRHTKGFGPDTYYHNTLALIDGLFYAFDEEGYLITDTDNLYIDNANMIDIKVR